MTGNKQDGPEYRDRFLTKNQQLKMLNQQLEATNRQLASAKQQLKAANQQLKADEQQLKADEQQLRAANQQLRAIEQQLRAANQQLKADEQQLKAANQQLKANEIELRHSRARYKAMFEFTMSCIAVYEGTNNGKNFLIKNLNPAAEKIEKVNKQDLLGRDVREVFPAIEEMGLLDVFKRVYKTGKAELFPLAQYKDGQIEGWRENFVFKLPSGELVAIYKDVTKLKQAEEQLVKSEFLYKEAQSLSHIGNWSLEIQNEHVFWSDELYSIFEVDKKDGALSVEDFLERVHPEDRDVIREQIENKKTHRSEYRIVMDDGSIKHIHEEVLVVHQEDGNVLQMKGTAQDITKLKERDAILDTRLKLSEASLYHSIDGVIQLFLDEAEKLTGSEIGFFHFLEEDQQNIKLQTWSANTLKNACTAEGKDKHYPVRDAGVWVDCIRERRPVIHNDYESLPDKKGLPPGHVPIIRELVLPVIRDGKIRFIIGVGNKKTNYNERDVKTLSVLADMAWDIIERKRAEVRISRFSRIFEDSLNEIYLFRSDDLKFTQANKAALQNLGYTFDELQELTPLALKPGFTLESFEELLSPLRKGETEQIAFEAVHKRKDGSLYDAEVHLQFLKHENETLFAAIVLDITKRKQAEKELRQSREHFKLLYERSPLGYQSLDSDGNLIEINHAWLALLGYDKKEVIGRSFSDFLASGCANIFKERFQNFKFAGDVRSIPFEMIRKDGRHINVEVDGKVNLSPDGNFKQTHCVLHDVTERVKAEKQIKENQERLRALTSRLSTTEERERKRIAEGIHDSVIQPLIFLDVKMKSLQKAANDNKTGESFDQMRTILAELVKQSRTFIFDLSHPILYELGLEAAIEEWLRSEIEDEHGVTVDLQVKTETKDLDQSLKTFLFKTVKELLINVIKHAKANNVKVSIARQQNNIILCVKDNGCGFDQGDHRIKLDKESGFGLFIIHEQLTYLGGEINITSKPDAGSEIVLTVPAESKT